MFRFVYFKHICVDQKRNPPHLKENKTQPKSKKNIMIEMNDDFSFVHWLMHAQCIIGVSSFWLELLIREIDVCSFSFFNAFTMMDQERRSRVCSQIEFQY